MPKTANKLPAAPFPRHLRIFTRNACYLAAMRAAKSTQALGSCLMYTWFA